jgi:hypothetical protein
VKAYKELRNKLWNRWVEQFKRNIENKYLLLVEYFPSVGKDLAKDIALWIYKKHFDLDVNETDIIFVEKEALKWWIKVYKDDFMVDVSFSKIEKLVA